MGLIGGLTVVAAIVGLVAAAVLNAGLKVGLAAMLDGYPLRGGVPLVARLLLLEVEGP